MRLDEFASGEDRPNRFDLTLSNGIELVVQVDGCVKVAWVDLDLLADLEMILGGVEADHTMFIAWNAALSVPEALQGWRAVVR